MTLEQLGQLAESSRPGFDPHEKFLDWCINYHTHIWKGILQFEGTDDWSYLKDLAEEIAKPQRDSCDANQLPHPDLQTCILLVAVDWLIKLGKFEFGVRRIRQALHGIEPTIVAEAARRYRSILENNIRSSMRQM